MGLPPAVKYIIACLTCGCWCPFYCFINSSVRGCVLCFDTIGGAKNVVFKILACIFFCFCLGVIDCIFSIMGLVYLFQGPCEQFASSGDYRQGYQALVKGDNYPIEVTVKGALKSIF